MARKLQTPEYIYGPTSYCPGCGHGIVSKLIGAVMEELGMPKTIGCVAVGCSCLMPESFGIDWIQAQHGRAPAVAGGVKRVRPDAFVFTYQGDGDAGAIGFSETVYSAKRNEQITTFFINNGVFGMTGGQMAPTSLQGQVTPTSPAGCDYGIAGKPLKLAELLATFDVGYIARGSLANYKEINKTKKYIKNAMRCQMEGRGYAFVEILSTCPTNWKLSPLQSFKRLEKESSLYFPCGELVNKGKDTAQNKVEAI